MTKVVNDALLPITRLLLLVGEWLFAGLAILVGGLGAAVAAALALGYTDAAAEVAKELPSVPVGHVALGIFLATFLVAILLALLWQFIRRLRGIVDTVDSDPFVRANARRLREMGWITLFAFIPTVILTGVGSWFDELTKSSEHHMHIEGGIDMGQIVLILLLFILARVFERGADMREELEGTV